MDEVLKRIETLESQVTFHHQLIDCIYARLGELALCIPDAAPDAEPNAPEVELYNPLMDEWLSVKRSTLSHKEN